VISYKKFDSIIDEIKKFFPDCILLDVMFPGISGYEIIRRIKSEFPEEYIPIIMLSAKDQLIDIKEGFRSGANDYITKPFQVEEVLIRVKTHLALRNMQKTLEEKNAQLEDALANVKTLRGLLPICANCKKIRDDQGYWTQLEKYIETHSDALFSHGICPECMETLYGDQEWYQRIQNDL
jgi:CheY-like chemotaxis protein